MRTSAVAIIATLVLAGSSGAALAAPSAFKPTLTVVKLSPLTIRGSHFAAGERVSVTLRAVTVKTVRTVVDRHGTFVARLEGLPSGCTVWSVVAVGARTGRVVLVGPRIECRPMD